MELKKLGKTNLMVSQIGMGGIPLTRPSEEKAIELVQQVIEQGVNFIDTAIGYAPSEERIGKAIHDRRESVIIASKGGWRNKETTLKHIDQSLKNLQTDYIDIWQFHGVNSIERYEENILKEGALDGAREALDAGKIRHIGFSSHSLDTAIELVPTGNFSTVQVPFNFILNEPSDRLVALTQEHNVGFIAMKPFAGGRLREANLVMKFLLQFDNVVPIPGIEKIEEIIEIIDIVKSKAKPSPKELQEMKRIREEIGTKFCRRCGYCMPCPEEVQISSLMTMPVLYDLWPIEKFLNWSYIKNNVQSAEKCTKCGSCEEKCPYNLPIREMIEESVAFYKKIQSENQN